MAETATPRPAATHDEADHVGRISSERLMYFSDAVIAIAITLLALELPVPTGDVHGNASVLEFLREHLPEYLSFLVSFAVIATHWMAHQRLFRYATGVAGGVIRWNLLWLLMIVIMPFTTKLLTSEADAFQVQFIMYAANQALAGLFLRLAFSDLLRSKLLRVPTLPEAATDTVIWMDSVAVTFVVSIPIALVTHWASLCWTLYPVTRKILRVVERRAAGPLG
ncbi:TMEM175 family protein [Streptomyces sioyaensis]|uniref:TMEM175 family protein n=1 Tax=Streptomyces sioyaensis TaxID=67364 RepID=UPI0036A9C358